MKYRIDALMSFLASEYADSEESLSHLLSEDNLIKASELDMHDNTDSLKNLIYSTYKEFGFEHAKGIFEMTVVQAHNSIAA